MNTTPEYPDSADGYGSAGGDGTAYGFGAADPYGFAGGFESGGGYGSAAGAPYGQQPFTGAGFTGAGFDPTAQGYTWTDSYPAPGQYDPYLAAGYAGMRPDGTMQPYNPMQPYAPAYRASRKEPALALILSFFLPGLGTIVNGQGGKGVGIMLGYFMGALLSVILIGLPIMFGFWVWGMVDAYSGAKEHNARHGYY